MGSISGDSADWDVRDSSAHDERIHVSVRLRPLNERELAHNDVSDWECINSTTILFKNSLTERSMVPTAYTFDRVFGCDCPTRQVYEEGAKRVALSVINGIHSSIFAYGQTSSGKTYTMSGITEYTIKDIYDYIEKHQEREFVLKFAAMEIYNESVRDLLSSDSTPLRLLDDPERGTVVERLTEVTLTGLSHLRELLSVCEAQRQIGETALNEQSSRSHQILRLTVESTVREYSVRENSSTLAATVNFIDLAGSERASQTSSAGTRLKEGCHINRSLLTLGTVIRKLSKGRNGHIPYRDSKLTRILQHCLGGNGRTAIICTLSPAHSHVEQSRNTLLFANHAKQVSTNASVNVVMSEKSLVKQLQKELARLENELRNLSSHSSMSNSSSALREKEQLIEKMDKEIRELTQQRDLAQARIEDLLQSGVELHFPRPWELSGFSGYHDKSAWTDVASEASEIAETLGADFASKIPHFSDRVEGANYGLEQQLPESCEEQFLSDKTSPRLYIEKYFGPDPSCGWEKIAQETDKKTPEESCKELKCIEVDVPKRKVNSHSMSSLGKTDDLSGLSPYSSDGDESDHQSRSISRSLSCSEIPVIMDNSSSSEIVRENGNASPNLYETENPQEQRNNEEEFSKTELVLDDGGLPGKDSLGHVRKGSLDEEESSKILSEESPESQQTHTTGLQEVTRPEEQSEDDMVKHETTYWESEKPVDNGLKQENLTDDGFNPEEKLTQDSLKSEEKLADDSFKPEERNTEDNPKAEEKISDDSSNSNKNADDSSGRAQDMQKPASDWPKEFENQRREIIQLWDACKIPLVHRTYFYILFKGDPSDAVYLEVELRRLSFLTNTISAGGDSMKALNREREMLCKQMLRKFTVKEREDLYEKWGIGLKSKRRRLQLVRKLWTDTKNMDHINESSAIVAKLVGFSEKGWAPKEMFGLSFSQGTEKMRSFSWI